MIAAALTAAVSAHARHVAADTLEVAVVTAERGMIVSRTDSVSLDGLTDAGATSYFPSVKHSFIFHLSMAYEGFKSY
mgnify:CR=1 FL=1